MGRRHVVSWRLPRRNPRDALVCAFARKELDGRDRFHRATDSAGIGRRTHRQLYQCGAMGTAVRCAMGDDIPDRRQSAASSFAALRVRTRGTDAVCPAVVVFQEAAAGGRGVGTVPAWLWDSALRRRIYARAGRLPRVACSWILDGTVAQRADDSEWWRTARLGLSQKN